jgi:hypothetical protein
MLKYPSLCPYFVWVIYLSRCYIIVCLLLFTGSNEREKHDNDAPRPSVCCTSWRFLVARPSPSRRVTPNEQRADVPEPQQDNGGQHIVSIPLSVKGEGSAYARRLGQNHK